MSTSILLTADGVQKHSLFPPGYETGEEDGLIVVRYKNGGVTVLTIDPAEGTYFFSTARCVVLFAQVLEMFKLKAQ